MNSICVFGSNDLAEECLRIIHETMPESKLCVVRKKDYNSSLDQYCDTHHIQVVGSANDLHERFDLGFTFRFHQIIRPQVLSLFDQGIINMHGGPLPEYRGSANHIFAIMNGENEYGVTLHWLTEGIDEGPIIKGRRFPINDEITGYELLQRTFAEGLRLFCEFLPNLWANTIPSGNQQDLNTGTTYRVSDLEKYRYVDMNQIESSDLSRRLRAFYHPERPSLFARISDQVVHLKLSPETDKSQVINA